PPSSNSKGFFRNGALIQRLIDDTRNSLTENARSGVFERLIENWLTSTTERQYQFAFCQALVAQGYEILHISSHGPQEQGKDIIARDPTGRPIGYQLKTGNIDLGFFRRIYDEVVELVEIPIQFPGVPPDGQHRCVLVT